ncbi:hypothetical protein ACL2XO_21325 [Sodalis sp. RH15]|uniref:hypothetical protein n=1 Tax=Sodalis sp. RH15 TaxID=3394330 RepID=UPI0039B5BD86
MTICDNDNGYAVWDGLIAKSGGLLTKDELLQISGLFENAFKQAAPSKRGDNYGAVKAALGIKAAAQALGDANMFERSVLISCQNQMNRKNKVLSSFVSA